MGRSVTITERGVAVGRIVPVSSSLEEKLGELRDAGIINWNGKKFSPRIRRATRTRSGRKSVSELLLDDRE
jgi:antitoxin (DNA-binding transcriptional repressor) of toxin-antitoxin stability system